MISPRLTGFRPSRRFLRAFARFRRASEGIAAVEFALILPLMLLLYLGSAETTQSVIASRKAAVAAQTISDIITQQSAIVYGTSTVNVLTNAYMGGVFNAASIIMQPFSTSASGGFNPLAVNVAAVSFTAYTAMPVSGVPAGSIYIPNTTSIATSANPPTTANPGYSAKVRWVATPAVVGTANTTLTSTYALNRVCSNTGAKGDANPVSTPLVPDTTNAAKPTATSLPSKLYGAGSLILADIAYSYTPVFGASIVKFGWNTATTSNPLASSSTMYNTPRDNGWSTANQCTDSSGGSAGTADSWICYTARQTGTCAYN